MTIAAFDHASLPRPAPDCRIGRPRPVDFRALVGRPAWFQLPEAVRRRFETHAEPHIYPGRMQVRASLAGRLLAQALRLVGTPLAPFVGPDVPVTVEVRGDGRGGVIWDRDYRFAGHAHTLVSSTKRVAHDGQLMEVVRGGLGMTLTATVENRALHFRSGVYFLQLGALRLFIPSLLTPGAVHVIHEDRGATEGPGWFRFEMRFVHPWLGETFYQEGLFRDPLELTPEGGVR